MPDSDLFEQIQKLTNDVLLSPFFAGRTTRSGALLRSFKASFPNAPEPYPASHDVTRLNDDLTSCFRGDRRLWLDPQQARLYVPHRKGGSKPALACGAISEILTASEIFWFHQTARIAEKDGKEDASNFLVYCEPLFFYSEPLRAYVRLLDINHPGYMEASHSKKLAQDAHAELSKALIQPFRDDVKQLTKHEKRIQDSVNSLNLVPVRHYLPAGDNYAGRHIRKWFLTEHEYDPSYKEVRAVSPEDERKSNLVLIGSRRILPPVIKFEEAHPTLVLSVTDRGISENYRDSFREWPDENGTEGVMRSRVIVTNWVRSTGNAYTIIGGNHTRAIGEVGKMLTEDEKLKDIVALLLQDGRIPENFQFALEVNLKMNESDADPPVLMTGLRQNPVVYKGKTAGSV